MERRWFAGSCHDGYWWFRVFGWGLAGKDVRRHGLDFSERGGHQTLLIVRGWAVKGLRP